MCVHKCGWVAWVVFYPLLFFFPSSHPLSFFLLLLSSSPLHLSSSPLILPSFTTNPQEIDVEQFEDGDKDEELNSLGGNTGYKVRRECEFECECEHEWSIVKYEWVGMSA